MLVWLPGPSPGLTSNTAMPYPADVSLRADQTASSAASAAGRWKTPGVEVAAGRLARVNTFARGVAPGAWYSPSQALVPPQPRVRYTVPWLVSKAPLSVVVTGCGRRVLTTAPVVAPVPALTSMPALASAPRQGKVRS